MHPRKLIRDAVVANLTNRTSAGTNVYTFRPREFRPKNEYPALLVVVTGEQVTDASATTAPRELTREVEIAITARVLHSDSFPVDDAMDAISEEIENVINADRHLGDTASDCILKGTEFSVSDPTENSPITGEVMLSYSATYYTSSASGTLDDFLRADVTTKFVGSDDDNAPTDAIDVRGTP